MFSGDTIQLFFRNVPKWRVANIVRQTCRLNDIGIDIVIFRIIFPLKFFGNPAANLCDLQ